MVPLHARCGWPFEHVPPVPEQCLSSLFKMASLLDIHFVGFLIGSWKNEDRVNTHINNNETILHKDVHRNVNRDRYEVKNIMTNQWNVIDPRLGLHGHPEAPTGILTSRKTSNTSVEVSHAHGYVVLKMIGSPLWDSGSYFFWMCIFLFLKCIGHGMISGVWLLFWRGPAKHPHAR